MHHQGLVGLGAKAPPPLTHPRHAQTRRQAVLDDLGMK